METMTRKDCSPNMTFELEAKGANQTKTRRENIPERGNTKYQDSEGKGLISAQKHHHKTDVIGVTELGKTGCNAGGGVTRSQIRKDFVNLTTGESANFL